MLDVGQLSLVLRQPLSPIYHAILGCSTSEAGHAISASTARAPAAPAHKGSRREASRVMFQAAGTVQNTPVMDATHYGWATMTLLAQLNRGAANLPSAFLTQAQGYVGQWICASRVS